MLSYKYLNSIIFILVFMNSNNNTLYNFGMEYSYIALSMNNMLKLTNNNIKNMEINKTIGIAIDANYGCIFAFVGGFLSGSLAVATLVSVLLATGPVGWLVGAILVGSYIAFGVSLGGIIFSC